MSRRTPAPRLTVAVEAEALCRYPFCGIARIVVHQYRHLTTLRPSWRFEFFHRTPVPSSMLEALPFVRWRQIDVIGERFVPLLDAWMDIRLPMAAFRAGADVLHCPANAGPRFGPPLVLSVLDLIPIQTESERAHVQRWFDRLRAAARRAKRVITISEASRRDIVSLLGVPDERIRVQSLAPWQSDSTQTVLDAELIARQDVRYVLAFGSLRRNKNLSRLIEAWGSMPEQVRRGHKLLLVGIEPHERVVIQDWIAARNLSDACELVGQVPDQTLAGLLAGATALAYVSTIEGFGLPILEAFAAGVAVVTSRTSSMPEVAGDAALLVDPQSNVEIAAALSRVLEDDVLREALISKGRQRVTQFSWQRSAAQLCEVLEETAGR